MTLHIVMNSKLRTFIPFLLFIFTFGLYLYNMSPSITTGDSGEFCAASVILGIAHSPGYPLYSLIGKSFSSAVPFGSLAYRINLISAISGGLAVLLMFLLVFEATKSITASLTSSLLLAFYRAFWTSSIQSEVFTLNAFFVVLILFTLYLSLSNLRYIFLSVFILGLATGNHQTVIAVTPVFLAVLWKQRKQMGFNNLVLCALMFILGFSVYAYLPIRSFKNPALDWSNPENLNNFIRVLTRKDYGTFQLTVGQKEALSLSLLFKQIARYFATLNHHITLFGILIGFSGWVLFMRKQFLFALGNLVVFIGSGIGLILMANLPFDAMSEGIFERFYILPAIPFCLACGYTVNAFSSKNRLFGLLFVFILGFSFFNSKNVCNWRNYFLEYDYGKNILRTLDKNSILFMDGGDDTFYSTAYLCFAENRRPDIELHDRGGLVFKNIYGDDFRRLSKEEKEARRQTIEKQFVSIRPLYYSTFKRNILPGVTLYPAGILFKAGGVAGDSWQTYSLLRSAYSDFPDYRSNALVPIYTFMRTFSIDAPSPWWQYSFHKWREVEWLTSNIKIELHNKAYENFQKSFFDKAEYYYNEIIKLDSKDVSALLNLGVLEERKNNNEKARELYERAILINPAYSDAYYNLGSLYWKQGNWQKVIECFSKVLEYNPRHPSAGRYLQIAEERLRNSDQR